MHKITKIAVLSVMFFMGFNSAHAWEITGTLSGSAEASVLSGTVTPNSGGGSGGTGGGSSGGTGGGAVAIPPGGGVGFGGYGGGSVGGGTGGGVLYGPPLAQGGSNEDYLIPGPPPTGIGPLFNETNAEGKLRFGKDEAVFTVIMASLIALSAVRFAEKYYYQKRISGGHLNS